MKYSRDIICTINSKGLFTEVSESCKYILGYDPEELVGKSFYDLVHQPERQSIKGLFKKLMKEKLSINSFEHTAIRKNESLLPMQWSYEWSAEDQVLFCIGHDNSDLYDVWQKLYQKEEFYQRLVEYGSDMLRLVDKDGYYTYAAPSTTRILGYPPGSMIGKKAFSFIHPDDVKAVKRSFKLLKKKTYVQISDFRFKDVHGNWRWLETIISNQLNNPSVKALVVCSRDITERKNASIKLQESEQLFRSLFEHNPDVVLLSNKEEIIIDANPSITKVFGIPREKVINVAESTLLPAEIVKVCTDNFKKALEGIASTFEVSFHTEHGFNMVLDISKVPIIVNKEVLGVYSIVKDRSAIAQSYKTIQQQSEKVNSILESITDAFFTVDKNWCFTYVNSECNRLLQKITGELMGRNIWEVFPEEVGGEFYIQYLKVLKTGKPAYFKAYFVRLNMWAGVRAYPSEEGLSVYFVDVTERVKREEELKKLSVVASKTHNGVIILNKAGEIEWVNQSFSRITDYTFEEVENVPILSLVPDQNAIEDLFSDLFNQPLNERSYLQEIQFTTKAGRDKWLDIEVTPIIDHENINGFIIMITDVTEEKQTMQERLAFIEELKLNNESLHQFNQIVSHNLRAPVANIMGLTHIIDSDEFDEATKKSAVKSLSIASKSLDVIIRDLNDILTIRNQENHTKEHICINSLLIDVFKNLNLSEKDNRAIETDFLEADSIFTVKSYFGGILYNLISNAIKFKSNERQPKIKISTKKNDEYTILTVEDNGIGINLSKHKNNLFKLYHRCHKQTDGKGLGLFLVKTLVDALGGKIEVESKEGEGTTISIYIK